MKYLKEKSIYSYNSPLAGTLDTFLKPKEITKVTFHALEFTSLCPITGQPDIGEVSITYFPEKLCLESKSLKIYLTNYRMYQGFIEKICSKIAIDINKVLNAYVKVQVYSKTRGGIKLYATAEKGE